MGIKELGWAILKGSTDSLKGFYWLFNLNAIQRRAHEERSQFQELRRKPSPIHVVHAHHGATKEEPKLLTRVLQCCIFNGVVFGLSMVVFHHVILPCLQMILEVMFGTESSTFWYWLSFFLKATFDGLWVLPLFILSRIINALWFQDIGTLAYRYSVGRPKGMSSLSNFIADNLFSLIIQAFFLFQAMLVSWIPLWGVADGLGLFHMCLLYSLYSFEYKWVQMGWPLHQRLSFLETNWPYFLGFGLPLSLLTYWPRDILISGCLFAIFFPIFIISGNEADPIINTQSRRLELFSVVVAVSNALFSRSIPSKSSTKLKR